VEIFFCPRVWAEFAAAAVLLWPSNAMCNVCDGECTHPCGVCFWLGYEKAHTYICASTHTGHTCSNEGGVPGTPQPYTACPTTFVMVRTFVWHTTL
jgi:hypothetical protein